jgi:DNA-directed RNA polymerase subunit beta
VVSQLHRSPGYSSDKASTPTVQTVFGRIIPFKGSWIEFATDINNVMYAYIDRKKKLPVTTLLRAFGFESDKEILEISTSQKNTRYPKQIQKACRPQTRRKST